MDQLSPFGFESGRQQLGPILGSQFFCASSACFLVFFSELRWRRYAAGARERLALHCLSKVNGFEVYSPRIRPSRARRGDDTRPLFPGYCFVLIVSQWWAARWSPGIIRLVMDGLQPARVGDQVIDEIRRREVRGVVELPKAPSMRVGDRVKVLGGPFQGHLGLYAGMRPHARVEVLLAILGGQQRVTLAAGDVERCGI